MKLYWYTTKERLIADKIANDSYGFKEEPDYETIEKYDLRFVAYETWDKITEGGFKNG